ncbi:Extracellular ribonuclease precursor [Bremerella volcania]|uniref:Serine protease n=1 Tax=Bremerella volcania TaxID=2527984 RepID=A0A518C747_9BACT|nr:endonuclease [Bremerella volcania]QDU75053.1 Extracellular ribonuclease precursor [Bremerella volcania]
MNAPRQGFAKHFYEQIDRTAKRYAERKPEQEKVLSEIRVGKNVDVNLPDSIRKRVGQLRIPLELDLPADAAPSWAPMSTIPSGPAEISELNLGPVPDNIRSIAEERVLGTNNLMPIAYLIRGSQVSRSVGRVVIRNRFGQRVGFGTGFLVSPNLLLTNNHVLPDETFAEKSVVEFDFAANFAGMLLPSIEFSLAPTRFFFTSELFDFTLVAVQQNDSSQRDPREFGWIKLHESDPDRMVVKGEFVSIIQHPNGESKQIALRDNQVIDIFDNFLHYETDTAPGSSGAPVYNDQWELVALHHSGVPERDEDGDILAVNGQKWTESMGDHRIKWVSNEGILVDRIVREIKNASFSGEKAKLRDELLNLSPDTHPTESEPSRVSPPPVDVSRVVSSVTPAISQVTSGLATTMTIPLSVTISLGGLAASLTSTPPSSAAASSTTTSVTDDRSSQDPDLQAALAELEEADTRPYFDEAADSADVESYYSGINPDDLSGPELFEKLFQLLEKTHASKLSYKPSVHLYPWIDLHEDGQLRSIYSGKKFSAEEFIREDFRIMQLRSIRLREMLAREGSFDAESMHEAAEALEASLPFNCEHSVPQSWFLKRQPMRGDLHHLFACEVGCNSFRGNTPYFDFSDFEETVRDSCGKSVEDRFEPASGKGAVARAMLYFLVRYPDKLASGLAKKQRDRIETLRDWHRKFPVDRYEQHRNQAIFQKQGNRNPFIDHPDWADKVSFDEVSA